MSAPFWASKLAAELNEARKKLKPSDVLDVYVEVKASALFGLLFDNEPITPREVCEAVCANLADALNVYPDSVVDEARLVPDYSEQPGGSSS